MGIHDYEKKYKAALKGVKEADISDRNKELILSYVDDLVLNGISIPRRLRTLSTLKMCGRVLDKDFDKVEILGVKKIVSHIEQCDYTYWTKYTHKVIIRLFFKWIKGTKEYPDCVSWISLRKSRAQQNLPGEGDLLTEKEIQQLLTVCASA
jgi:site-specific recombinase XerD